MNRIIVMIGIIILILSLAGNAVLGVLLFAQFQASRDLDGAKSEISKLETDLSSTQQQLEETKAELAEKTESLADMSRKYAAASTKYQDLMCAVSLSADDLKDIDSNPELGDVISSASETYYRESPVDVTFDLLWSNTKSALFTVRWPDQSTSKSVAIWEYGLGGEVTGIYNVGEGCFFYVP